MHIVMVSDQEADGGAALAASRLAEGLAVEHRVSRCVLFSRGSNPAWQTVSLGPSGLLDRTIARVGRGLRRRLPGWIPAPSRVQADSNLRSALERLRPDVINIHNIHAGSLMGWSTNLIRISAEFAPVVCTLHDMWSFTGRCAYSYDCRMFETGCDASCPTPHEYPQLDPSQIREAWVEKQLLFRQLPDLVAVSPSRWLADEALRGCWAGHRVEVIANVLPLNIFRPRPRSEARRALGLDCTGPVILVSAQLLTERRKGGAWLSQIWEHVGHRPITLLTVGQGQVTVRDPQVRVISLGYVGDVEKMVQAYNAADIVLHAAPVDNLPNVVVEAIACGTPVVGMPVGGVGEIIKPGVSGWLSEQPTLPSLAAALTQALDEIYMDCDLRGSCRALAVCEFSTGVQIAKYCLLFRDIQLERRKAA